MKKGFSLIVGGNRGIGKEIFNLFSKKNINTYALDIENRKSISIGLWSAYGQHNISSNLLMKNRFRCPKKC